MKTVKQVLFISYDGMTDPLGQSQVLPYLVGLSKLGFLITILSTEKKSVFNINFDSVFNICKQAGINWEYIFFSKQPPVIAKLYDQFQLKSRAVELYKKCNFDIVHCRSYVAADVGMHLKKRFGTKFLFDMRGFWVDERIEGGIWDLNNPIFRQAYRSYKRKEAEFIANADGIVSLTEEAKREISTWPAYSQTPITVIPCSADFSVFKLVTPEDRYNAREKLNLDQHCLVISYLGAIGTWYLLDEMLLQFSAIKSRYPTAKMLFVTQEPREVVLQSAHRIIEKYEEDLIIMSAKRTEVPKILAASDLNIFFIKPSYSKKASSPTKLGEILAMGLPVICNSGVGDVSDIIDYTNGGLAISSLTLENYQYVSMHIEEIISKGGDKLRHKAKFYYDLEKAINKYYYAYMNLF